MNPPRLKIRSQGMLGTHHSWAVVMRNLLTQFQVLGHKLYLSSTNGTSLIPPKLFQRLNSKITDPDLDICYTAPQNFPIRFKPNSRLKMAIYNYETSHLPHIWRNKIKHLDYVLPSSNFSREVFINSGWPEQKCVVVPHGINPEDFKNEKVHQLFFKDEFKFLNVSIPHYRKNIPILLNAYFSAFSNQDEVCLVLKTKLDQKRKYRFEIDLRQEIIKVQKKYKDRPGGLPKIEIVQDRLSSMIPLYNACHVLVSASSAEGFGMPLLEGLAAGKVVISPRCTGQLDFLNDQNSLLVDVQEIEAGVEYQYWQPTIGATTYLPNKDSLADAMIKSYQQYDQLKSAFRAESIRKVKQFTWEAAAKKILDLK